MHGLRLALEAFASPVLEQVHARKQRLTGLGPARLLRSTLDGQKMCLRRSTMEIRAQMSIPRRKTLEDGSMRARKNFGTFSSS